MRAAIILLLILGFFRATPSIAQAGIYINEVMGSNKNTIADSTGSYEDWLELYNSNSSIKPLNGYYITNDITNPKLFRLSGNLQISAHGYLILWASNDTTRGKTHLPFKISASGESIYLYATDGHTLIDSLSVGQEKTDISYGRTKDGSATFSFFTKPTPGATNNNSTGYTGILNPPVFSKPAGFYGNAFSLSITSDDPSAKIIYTTDGSNPDAGNTGGTVYRYKNQYQGKSGDAAGPFLTDSFRSINYVNPINIKDASANPNRLSIKSSTTENSYSSAPASLINKGTVVRAIASKSGYISSDIATATYFVTSNGQNKYTLPILSLAIPENDFYSWDSGIYNAGTDFDKWRVNNPSATVDGFTPCNWERSTEYMSSFELFTSNNTTRQLQANIGLSINGGYTRAKPQKALRVYFRSSYGTSDLNYRLFSDLPYKNYERLVLSNAGNDMTLAHMRDIAAQGCIRQLNFGSQREQPVIEFVNGEFWGLINARQRYDDNYFSQIWNIDKDSLDFGENQSTANNGTSTAIVNLRNFISSNSMTNISNYQSVQNQMDIDNFIDYNIAEIFFGNNDWPSNNLSYFRKRVPYTPGAPLGQDGRFRWIINDLDRALGLNSGGVGYNTLAWATGTSSGTNPAAWSTVMLRQLLTNTEFKTKFITRYADLLNTTFLPANVDGVVNYYRDLLSPHIAEHTARWRYPSSASAWNTNVDSMINYENARPSYARQHIRSQFSLGSEKQLTLDVSDSTQGFISVNTVDITPSFQGVPNKAYPWTGLYYQEIPVTLVAKPKQGYRFVRWSGDSSSTNDTIIVTLNKAKSFTAVFQSQPTTDSSKVITYWHFNSLPGTASLTSVAADTSLPGNAVITYPGTGAGYMDRSPSNQGSPVNAQFNQPQGYSLRARNPASTRYLQINAPTTGYKNIGLKYATTRTTNGADYQRIFYTNDTTTGVWQLKADSIVVPSPETNPFGLMSVDFSSDINTSNNSKFAIKIVFFGPNSTLTAGNDRFDNITITGIPLTSQDNPAIAISSDKTTVCSNTKVTFTAQTKNAGASPTFQWTKNNVNVGTNQNTYVDSSFQNQDFVTCKLTVNNTTLTSNKITITVSASPITITGLSKDAPSACGNNDGDITINQSGGTAPFQYSLGNVNYSSSNLFTNLGAGTYTAYVKDARGCTASRTDSLVKIPALTITLTKISPSACSSNNGKITINNSGGNSPFQYSLNNVSYFSSNVFSNLAAGTYTAYVKDADDCIASVTDVLANASALVITSLDKTSPSACNTNDGTITINNSGGTSPFKYSLDNINFITSNTFSNLAAGTYTAYVKDAQGCTTSLSDMLSNNSSLVLTDLSPASPTSCIANDGSITINISGGSSPFQYSLDSVTYSPSNTFNNLGAGTYTGYVRDNRGCTASLTDVINKYSSSLEINDFIATSASACRDDGSINIKVNDGFLPFQYSLNNVDYNSSNIFTNLAGGTYTAYVKDGKGCIDSVTDLVDKIPPIAVSLTKTSTTACSNDGTITIDNSGGNSPFQYSLDNVNYSENNEFFNLPAGAYTAYVQDNDGCVDSLSDVLTRTPIGVTLSATSASACSDDGSITISNSGGASPYQYSLNNVDYYSTSVFSNLAAGTYIGYVKDDNGCIDSVSTELTKPSAVAITSLDMTSASACSDDGSITINNSGGTSPYQYSLNNVDYYSANVFTNLAAGTYTVYVKDAKGCTASLTDVLDGASPLVVTSLSKTPPGCSNNGSITINNSGGTSPYQYSLNNADYFSSNVFTNLATGTYTAYVKDAKECIASFIDSLVGSPSLVITSLSKTSPVCNNNGSITINNSGGASPYQYSLDNVNYFSSNTFTNLASGSYTAYVKDANGCTASLSDTLTGPSPLGITSLSKTSPSCTNDGKITINITGGTSPYQYSLDNVNYVSSNTFTNLAAGNYTAYVKDVNGCAASFNDVLAGSPPLSITGLSKTNPSACSNDGQITINKTGGSSPYQYSLDNVNYSSSNVFTNLAAGTYTTYVKDARGCIASSVDSLAGSPALVITSVSKVNPSACSTDGQITINKSGGTSPYQYSLDNVNYFSSNVFTKLAAGNYTAYVKDAKGCKASLSVVLTGSSSTLAITSLSKTSASACNTGGAITINRSGGTSPYQYSLNNVNYFSSNVFTNLAGGKYTAYVKDAKGCVATFTDTLSKVASIVVTISKTQPSACANNGVITITKTGGSSPFTYSLNNSSYSSSNVFSNLAAGKYKAYVKDTKGCIALDSVVLTKPAAIALTLDKTNPSVCANNGVIKINKTGGTSPFTYSLNNVNYSSSNTFSNLAAGTYKVYAKDAGGCVASTSGTLTKPAALVISSVTKVNPSACSSNGKITINVTGGTSPYSYSLDSIHYFSSNVFSNLKAGTYTAYVKDAKGCKAKLTKITLTAPACTVTRSADQKLSAPSSTLSIKVFPNPSTDQFSMIAKSSDNREVEVIVTDVLGRKIIHTHTAPNDVLIFGKELTSGMYIIEALQGKGTATLKIVKEK